MKWYNINSNTNINFKKHLWAPSNYHGSVGQGFEVVENYIRGQEGYEGD
jgi:hypothetical protein